MEQSKSKLPDDTPSIIQNKNRNTFVWRTGILGWGGFMVLWMTLFDWYKQGYIRIPPHRILLWSTIPNLVIWPLAGYFWGVSVWKHRKNPDV